jgi:hypothetical protein
MSQGEIDRSGSLGFFLYPDSYTLQLSQPGFLPQSQQIEVRESGSNTFSVDLIRNVGELSLQVTPADAKVMVNRVDYSGQRLIELAPGRYRLEVEKEHNETYSETIEIPLNQRISRVISLEAHTGTLQFRVSPNDAQVELVDASGRVVNRWNGTQILRDIQAGSYTLKISSAGHLPREDRFSIERNQMAQVTVELEEGALENWARTPRRRWWRFAILVRAGCGWIVIWEPAVRPRQAAIPRRTVICISGAGRLMATSDGLLLPQVPLVAMISRVTAVLFWRLIVPSIGVVRRTTIYGRGSMGLIIHVRLDIGCPRRRSGLRSAKVGAVTTPRELSIPR